MHEDLNEHLSWMLRTARPRSILNGAADVSLLTLLDVQPVVGSEGTTYYAASTSSRWGSQSIEFPTSLKYGMDNLDERALHFFFDVHVCIRG